MTDWRIEAGCVRFPEDNNVIGVPIDAERCPVSQEDIDLVEVSLIELRESDAYKFAKLMGGGVFMYVTITDRQS